MSVSAAVRSCLRQYLTFSGRARRSEYWWFTLVAGVFFFVAVALVYLVVGLDESLSADLEVLFQVVAWFLLAYSLAVTPPLLAVTVRRLHDIGRSGWWWWIGVLPFGGLVLLVFACLDSEPDNQYGPSPKPQLGYRAPATWS